MIASKEGKRIVYDDHIGTIRYQGPVKGKEGEWFGVEWDDPQRGKHSGTVGDVEYFQTKLDNAGSFFSTKRSVDFGRGFVEALREKYLANASTTPIDIGTSKEVQMIGWEKTESKLARLELLMEVGLSNMRIVGEPFVGLVQATCPRVTDLDLSKNLFADLSDIAKICNELKYLEILRLNHNRFRVPSQLTTQQAFRMVKILTVMGTFMDWNEYGLLVSYFPSLEELHAGFNRLNSLTPISLTSTIRVINLEHNDITNWSTVDLLGNLPNLVSLNLSDNAIEAISYTSGSFQKLVNLNLNRNSLRSWMDIHLLNMFPNLSEIRVAGNPICDTIQPNDLSSILVGRLRNAKRLNGSEISEKSRKDSECYYLNQAHKDVSVENFLNLHPRYQELCQLHGTPVLAKLETTMMERLITVTLLNNETNECIEKKVPKQTTIRSFKTIVARTLWPVGWQKAIRGTVVWSSASEKELPLDDELKSLDFYGISHGDTFRIAL
jgi:Leucine-rich repeat (LRR) protein